MHVRQQRWSGGWIVFGVDFLPSGALPREHPNIEDACSSRSIKNDLFSAECEAELREETS